MARRPQAGFTLVELLVVIVIIALLAALITPAVMGGMKAAKRAAIKTELDQLAGAIETFKAENGGSYPPSNTAQLKAFLQARYINMDPSELSSVPTLDNAEILVYILQGFSPDKRRPITGGGTKKPLFPFDPTRLKGTYPQQTYSAPYTSGTPYVYFNTSRYPTTNSTESYATNGTIKPYKLTSANGGGYANPKSFQIISTGLDNDFGSDTGYVLDTTGITGGHADNLVNFTDRQLIDYVDQ